MSSERGELSGLIHGLGLIGCGHCAENYPTHDQEDFADEIDVDAVPVAIADVILDADYRKYPYQSGDHTIIGPECFTVADAKAIAYKGEWYFSRRRITSAQERAELQPGTVCVDMEGNAWKCGTGSWVGTGDGPALWPEDDLTLIVLWEPNLGQAD